MWTSDESTFYWIVAPLLRRMRCVTTADFFEERYNRSLGIFYAIFGLFYFSLQIGLMLLGTGKTASAITDGAISAEVAIGVMTVLFLTYGLAGGMPAAIVTDFIQGLFIIVLSFLLVPYVLAEAGGFTTLHEKLPPEMFSLLAPGDPPDGYDRITVYYIFIIVVNGLVGTIAAEAAGRAEPHDRRWPEGEDRPLANRCELRPDALHQAPERQLEARPVVPVI